MGRHWIYRFWGYIGKYEPDNYAYIYRDLLYLWNS